MEPVVGPKAQCALTVQNSHMETLLGGDIKSSVDLWWLPCLAEWVGMSVSGAQGWAQT